MNLSTLPNEILFQIIESTHVNKEKWADLSNIRLVDQHLNHIVMLHLLGSEVHIAAIHGDISALRCLSQTQSLELPGRSFKSALHAAAEWGCEKTVTWLLQQRVKIDHVNGSPLQAAVERGHDNVVSLLLETGTDANLPVGVYGGVLVTAVFLERLAIVDLLSTKDPSLLHQRSAFGSPLDIAACRRDGNSQMLLTLVRAGADVIGSGSPILGAVICGHQQNVRTLLELGAPCEQGLIRAIQRRLYAIARLILRYKPDSLDRITTFEWSPLVCAAINDDFRMVLLILRKVQPAFRSTLLEMTETWRGLTPLDCAKRVGSRRIIRLLETTSEHKGACVIKYRSKRARSVSTDSAGARTKRQAVCEDIQPT